MPEEPRDGVELSWAGELGRRRDRFERGES